MTETPIGASCIECGMQYGEHMDNCPNKKAIGFRKELEGLLNKYSAENGCNTPDFILAQYLIECLETFNNVTKRRAEWYGHMDAPGQSDPKDKGIELQT